jgi:hypothetical protein
MKNYNNHLYSETGYIKSQTHNLANERLAFRDGERLGDVSILIEDNATCRKIRRIMEKRVCQTFWKNSSKGKRAGNRARYETRHQVSNHFKNIYGAVPVGFQYYA